MDEIELKQAIRDYIRDNLTVSMEVSKEYGSFGGSDYINLRVGILLEGEEFCSTTDYFSVPG